ncbi:MAG: DUF1361 domain-containing protein [Bacteroidota bacterium]|nr:DUF1361 domain-containing protein [Bacteroidota bacterium]MDP4232162.1 DUF1361 domain-containing protein [Bacteroidota bacterium]MDP4241130.1 DUF1361 domain-containing protein [Bacteroidota bacterium]MDP4286522.1 DUF1361 domain-containing protein [Bacteroidota bacterium]
MSDTSSIQLFRENLRELGTFGWMIWNGFLAILPVVLAIVFFKREEQPRQTLRTITFGLELGVVIALLPNAPYVATDLIHFLETVRQSDMSLWKLLATEFPIYVGFVLFGLLCYSFTTDRLLFALRMRVGKIGYWAGLFMIPLISSIGIYLGRVARFNSWDILTDPRAIIHTSQAAAQNLRVVKVVLSMWVLLVIVHQSYRVVHDGIRARLGTSSAQSRVLAQKQPSEIVQN